MNLTPKNWHSFQHYNKRNPPWIKLHRSLLDDYDFMQLPVASRALAPMLWLIASESKDGVISLPVPALAFRLRCSADDLQIALEPLISKGFFVDASAALARGLRCATPETETETETEEKNPAMECEINGGTSTKEASDDAALIYFAPLKHSRCAGLAERAVL